MPARSPATTRRTTLVGVGAGIAAVTGLTGCEREDLLPPGDAAPPAPAPSRGAPPADPDAEVVVALVTQVAAARAEVERVRREVPGLGPVLRRLARTHAAHLRVLEGAGGTPPTAAPSPSAPTPAAPATPAAALAQVLVTEVGLRDALGAAALGAASGALARLLASMSASLSQHAALLAREGSA